MGALSVHTAERGKPVLIAGATGYVGGRLAPRLLGAGYRVRCLVRDPRKIAHRHWVGDPNLEIFPGDVADPDTSVAALRGCGAAFYLVQSMTAVNRRRRAGDSQLAETFARAAGQAGIDRIIYLGRSVGSGRQPGGRSASRRPAADALCSGGVPLTVLRAPMIIGSGSAFFEILLALTETASILVAPRWIRTPCQPIAISNVLDYLVAALEEDSTKGRSFDIRGPDVVTPDEMIGEIAALTDRQERLVIPIPLRGARLSSLGIHLLTPVSVPVARAIVEELNNTSIKRSNEAGFPRDVPLRSAREAIATALADHRRLHVETTWSGAGMTGDDPSSSGGKVLTDCRRLHINAPPEMVFQAVCRIGGGHGYYTADWLWRLRGWMDRLLGGPGLHRGRTNPESLHFGEALDFWRVNRLVPNRQLQLRSEMKLPGDAFLDFEIRPHNPGSDSCELIQTACFKPAGFAGLLYWYAVLPLHSVVFSGLLNGIRRTAETLQHDLYGAMPPADRTPV